MAEFIQSLGRLLGRALSFLPNSIGSNQLGVLFPAVPAVLWFIWQLHHDGWKATKRGILIGLVITFISYAILFLYCVARTIYKEHRELSRTLQDIRTIVPKLQLDGFRLAAEIRDFALSLGEVSGPPPQADAKYRTAMWEHLQLWIDSYPHESDPQLGLSLIHGFATRKFAERVEQYMHLVGESGYPILNASGFVDRILDRRSLFRLAADIESVAISTNQFPSPRKTAKT